MQKPKKDILFWDTETSYLVGATFSLRPEFIHHNNLIEDWSIICGSYKWAGEDEVKSFSIKKYGDDKEVVKKLRDVLCKASVIVHHNGDKFDVRKLNSRIIYHGLEPLPKLTTVDTLKHVRRIAQFTSNRLDYLGQHLFGMGKIRTSEGLWMSVRNGDKKALKEMVDYNKQDVVVLEKLYDYLLPHLQSHPHVGVIQGKSRHESCGKCGSENLSGISKTRVTAAGLVKVQKQCNNCHSYTTFNK